MYRISLFKIPNVFVKFEDDGNKRIVFMLYKKEDLILEILSMIASSFKEIIET